MHNTILIILGLLFIVMLLVLLAKKLKIAYPIFLVIAGLGISFIPGIPRMGIDPDVIFLIFLPPLLYEAAWYTSWKDFWKWKRPISLLAFGLVFFTSVVVAYASSALIPGFTLAMGFLLGGIISPPDAVAAATVMKGLGVPKRAMTILEGESLVNDASSLIVFRFALAAILTGTFSMNVAVGQFFITAVMGLITGLAIVHIFYAIHRFLPTTPAMDAALTVMTPYVIFLVAEHFHFSGVIGVVAAGLFMSYRSHEVFQTGDTQLNMMGVWTTLAFVMNALVFVLIGLELPEIIHGLGDASIAQGIKYGLIISGITIGLRLLWVYPATFLPILLFRSIRETEVNPGWKGPLVVGLAGMRGVVSLATALSIPVLMTDGTEFPHRNLIIFITFVVIFVTLVVQGLTLPLIIKLIKIKDREITKPREEQHAGIRLHLHKAALQHLESRHAREIKSNELIRHYRDELFNDVTKTKQKLDAFECNDIHRSQITQYTHIMQESIKIQRQELFKLRKQAIYSDAEIRRMEMQLNLEDVKLSGHEH
ncbi:Na+/H+ antiporter [Flavobacterium psychrotrophum]|uniref:Na+/H+ antiporter n=1 Tax=Flavobacterium psychrotrophum TaxID=2294119 RepID=UPI000E32270D|nr:Na+/H+ antiporter [Flavobacterium psychrotrophum]